MPEYPDGRPDDEQEALLAFLRFQRRVILWKAEGLDADGLNTRTAASSLTLGGLVKHMALVESYWFEEVFEGLPPREPWASVDWTLDQDWEFTSSREDPPDVLRELYRTSIERADAIIQRSALDAVATGTSGLAGQPNLRWILIHLIGETARHAGHADLLREAVDGQAGWRVHED